jgi:ribose-phosphate pyrophosphokinase
VVGDVWSDRVQRAPAVTTAPILYRIPAQTPEGQDEIHILPVQVSPTGEPIITTHHIPSAILLRSTALFHLYMVLHWCDALWARFHCAPVLLLPYVPGLYRDRFGPTMDGNVLGLLPSLANDISTRHFESIVFLDPDNEYSALLFRNGNAVGAGVANAFQIRGDRLPKDWDVVIAPHADGRQRAFSVAQVLKLPCVVAQRRYDPQGNPNGVMIEPLTAYTHPLVVDSYCESGKELVEVAAAIAEMRANGPPMQLDLFVTHGLFTEGFEALTEHYSRIYTTDSVGTSPSDVPDFVEIWDTCFQIISGRTK